MKGKKKQIVKAGSILLAAIVIGTGAWVTDMQEKNQVPELTTFIDVDELVSIGEEEVPLASAPKVTVKTKKSTKVVKMKQKATKTKVEKKTTKKTSTKKKTSKTAMTTTKVETTTLVTQKYKKGSKKKTVQTTKKIKTTVTVMDLAAATSAEKNTNVTTQTSAAAAKATTAAASTQNTPETGVMEISKIAPLADTRIKTAYEALGFTVEVDPTVSYTGYFTAREQRITLRRNDDTIYHELGHFLAFVAGNVDVREAFKAVYQEEKDLMEGVRKAYATQNSSEYFAESFREYTLDPVTLQNKRPKTYQSIVNALNVVTETQTSRILAVYGGFWNNNK